MAKCIGFEGEPFRALDPLKEMFGIFEPHTFSEKDDDQNFGDNERHAGRGGMADDFALQVRAAVARRRRSAAIEANAKAAALRTARFRRQINKPRLPLLPPLNNKKDRSDELSEF